MKRFLYLASIALLCCGFGMAQSTTDSSQSGQSTQRPTPPGDQRDQNGNTVAPDGTVTPKGANTPGSDSSQPTSMSSPDSQQTSRPTPPGDQRDQNGNTVAPDGTTTPPSGTNTPGAKSDSTPPDAK